MVEHCRLGWCSYLICVGLNEHGKKVENETSSSLLKPLLRLRDGLIEGSVSVFPKDFYFIQVS